MRYKIAFILLLPWFCAKAEVYKWVDGNGNVHYGDKPQNEVAMPVRIDKAPAASVGVDSSREEKRKRIADSFEEDRLAKEKEREELKKKREKLQKECNYLRDRQKRFQHAGSLYTLDKDGNRVFLSSETRQSTEKKLSKRIKQVCK